jgi:hypothetical protein
MRWRVLTLRLLGHFTDDRLKLEQLQLRLRKFSPPAPYFSIRISRSRSSSKRILSSAYCSLLFSCAMSSRSAGAEGMGGALTMGY